MLSLGLIGLQSHYFGWGWGESFWKLDLKNPNQNKEILTKDNKLYLFDLTLSLTLLSRQSCLLCLYQYLQLIPRPLSFSSFFLSCILDAFDDFLEDTESCFGPEIFILNLGCSIVMTLQEQERGQGQDGSHDAAFERVDTDRDLDLDSDEGSGVADVTESKGGKRKKYLWLPARSLLVLRGAARYSWSHGIAPRTTDKVHSTHTLCAVMCCAVLI